jgi:ubiquinol-cytochrome c reductase cytochrome b subunit
MTHAIETTETQLTSRGAEIVHVRRSSATQAQAFAASGGTVRSAVVTATTLDTLENQISAKKTELGQTAPFYRITREQPFVVTVTMFAQILTAYYFLFFLVILPLLGLRETPGRVPDTIAKSVSGSTPQGA